VLLLEHATASLDAHEAQKFGHQVRAIAADRGVAVVAMTADLSFAAAVAEHVFVHNGATGALTERRRGWFSRRLG
jgi:ABC-type hemin transport system ATPase subunit